MEVQAHVVSIPCRTTCKHTASPSLPPCWTLAAGQAPAPGRQLICGLAPRSQVWTCRLTTSPWQRPKKGVLNTFLAAVCFAAKTGTESAAGFPSSYYLSAAHSCDSFTNKGGTESAA